MLFLLNDVVLDLREVHLEPKLPRKRLRALTETDVAQMGRELYAEDPLLHDRDRPRAKRLAALIAAKNPGINAARFEAPQFDCDADQVGCSFAKVRSDLIADLHRAQQDGVERRVVADRKVWRRFDA
jgi:hypothetical protein